jgi:hypothetical protein
LVLWLNQVTRRFSGEPPQTPRADFGREPLPCTGFDQRLRLAFLATMRPVVDPAGHRVPRVSLLVSPFLGGPARHRPFAPTLHLHQRKSSRNLHLQYSAKSQSTPRCQSLITTRSDHPLVLGRSGAHQSSQLEKYLFHYLSEIWTMPEQKLSLLMWLIYIIHISRFLAEDS